MAHTAELMLAHNPMRKLIEPKQYLLDWKSKMQDNFNIGP